MTNTNSESHQPTKLELRILRRLVQSGPTLYSFLLRHVAASEREVAVALEYLEKEANFISGRFDAQGKSEYRVTERGRVNYDQAIADLLSPDGERTPVTFESLTIEHVNHLISAIQSEPMPITQGEITHLEDVKGLLAPGAVRTDRAGKPFPWVQYAVDQCNQRGIGGR